MPLRINLSFDISYDAFIFGEIIKFLQFRNDEKDKQIFEN